MCTEKRKFTRAIPWIIGGVALAVVAAFFFGFFVKLLWNWLMPDIFGLGTISYWQAWGLVLLAHILFKTGHHDSAHTHGKEQWKAKFQRKFHERCREPEKGTHSESQEADVDSITRD